MTLTDDQKGIINEIHEFVKKTCEGFPEEDIFLNHVLGVKNYSVKLAELYKGNIFVVTIAAYLQDISYLQTKELKNHEIESAKFSKKHLAKFDIPNTEIELIAKCILNHRGSKARKRKSTEEKITSCADAMDEINRYEQLFTKKRATMKEKETIKWITSKILRGWDKIELPKGQEIVKAQFEAAKTKFKINK